MYETRRHIKKLWKRAESHGLAKAVEYDWNKSHPIARTGFGLITAIGVAAIISIGGLYTYKAYDDHKKENPKIEQSEPITNYPSQRVFEYYRNLRELLD